MNLRPPFWIFFKKKNKKNTNNDLAAPLHASCTLDLPQQGGGLWLLFHRKFINCLLKHCEIWKQGQFTPAFSVTCIGDIFRHAIFRHAMQPGLRQKCKHNRLLYGRTRILVIKNGFIWHQTKFRDCLIAGPNLLTNRLGIPSRMVPWDHPCRFSWSFITFLKAITYPLNIIFLCLPIFFCLSFWKRGKKQLECKCQPGSQSELCAWSLTDLQASWLWDVILPLTKLARNCTKY